MEDNKKAKNIRLTLYIIGIMCLLIGVSYATYTFILKGSKENQVNIGSLTLTYEETNNINVVGDTLKTDEEGIASNNIFNFKVSVNNSTNININYIVYLTVDENYITNAGAGKIYLKNKTTNRVYGPTIITDLEKYKYDNSYKLVANKFTNTTETHEYELKAWITTEEGRYEDDTTHKTYLGGGVKFKVSVETVDKSGVEKLIELTDNVNDSGLYKVTHEADSTLQIGATESVTEYRYRGANPKNYVTFNGETWRIIGVFPTDDGNGNIENRIKLIRNESIGDKYWNTTYVSSTSSFNNWTGAALQTELNGTYLNSLTSEAQSMISNAKYYLGGYDGYVDGQGYTQTPVQMYSYERKIQNTTSNEFYYGTNPNSWIGKIALMYVSDYGYASDTCESKMLYSKTSSTDDLRACNDTNWLYKGIYEWLLPQDAYDMLSVFIVLADGYVHGSYNVRINVLGVRPVVYLTSSVQITGGDGTSSSPYTLGL